MIDFAKLNENVNSHSAITIKPSTKRVETKTVDSNLFELPYIYSKVRAPLIGPN